MVILVDINLYVKVKLLFTYLLHSRYVAVATLTTLKTLRYNALNKTWHSKQYFYFSSRLLQLNQKPNQLSNPDLSVHSSTL